MEYIYAVMLLHSAGKEITATAIKKILMASGFKPDPNRIKCLVLMLKDVNIDEVIKSIQLSKPQEQPITVKEEKLEVKKDKEKEKKEFEVEGLELLFGK